MLNERDVAKARADTPGCKKVIHLNNAGAALMPKQVLESVMNHLKLEAEIGGYEAAEQQAERIEHTYDSVSSLIHCDRDEIAIVENATRAWDMAFYGIQFKSGDRILTARSEYASNYIAYLQVAKHTGAVVEPIPNDQYGQVDIEALKNMIDDRVKLIAVTHVPTNGGLVNPAPEIGAIAKDADVLYLLDACQSIGQIPIDVQKIQCSILSATGRKYLRGPRATGFLYVHRSLLNQLEPPFLDLHAATWITQNHYEIREDARRFENWETYHAGKIGLGTAVDYAMEWGLERTWSRIVELANYLRAGLQKIDGITIHDLGKDRCGIVTFSIAGYEPEAIKRTLLENRINVSISLPEDTRIDMDERRLGKMIRSSVHYYNTTEEIDRFCEFLKRLSPQGC